MNVLDIFSGIGGFSLGLERAGMRTVAFCEIDPYARAVLAKHWPGVPCYDDVRTLTADRLRADGIIPDVICGGFPCQDISTAGKGAGIDGERSGLWADYCRLIDEIGPSYVIVENVSALLTRGLDRVLRDLAAIRYDAEWHCIPASAVGARHRRDRIWIVANPGRGRLRGSIRGQVQQPRRTEALSSGEVMADAEGIAQRAGLRADGPGERRRGRSGHSGGETDVPHPAYYAAIGEGVRRGDAVGLWRVEPGMGRVAHGVSSRVDRLSCLGNAVVPQIPQIIGEAIMAVHRQS